MSRDLQGACDRGRKGNSFNQWRFVVTDVPTKVIEECIDALMNADNASGYCTCGARVVMHKSKDHAPVDSGDLKAEQLIEKLRGLLP